MNAVHFHLLLNHVPVVVVPFALLILIAGLASKNRDVIRVALWLFLLSALITIPVYYTGEPSEEHVEHIAGVSRDTIHEHEESAEFNFASVGLLGVVALIGLIQYAKHAALARWFSATILILSIIVSAIFARTAYLGGLIRHAEILKTPPPVEEHQE